MGKYNSNINRKTMCASRDIVNQCLPSVLFYSKVAIGVAIGQCILAHFMSYSDWLVCRYGS